MENSFGNYFVEIFVNFIYPVYIFAVSLRISLV